jgi:hypothetical protein
VLTPTEGCDCWPLPAVVAPINTPTGVQRCDMCALEWMGDLDAALLLALQLSGAEVRFWQDDPQLLAELDEDGRFVEDWAEVGFTQRSYARPARADDCVLSGTDPWVEIDGRPVDWVHVLWVLDAGFNLPAWPPLA